MPNTSATGGPLAPAATPAPLEGRDLLRFVQTLFAGICGLPGTQVRPRWQPEPPNIPTAGTAWAAIGITKRPSDTYPYVKHEPSGDSLQRHEDLDVLASFYDLGAGSQADGYAALLRDGLAIEQNREPLELAGFGLVSVGDLTAVPSLLKERWLYRVDLTVILRRAIERVYPVLDVATAVGTIETDVGLSRPINVHQ